MAIEVDAVYENGMLKPLQPLDLAENERVVVSIIQKANGTGFDQFDVDFVHGAKKPGTYVNALTSTWCGVSLTNPPAAKTAGAT